MTDDFTAAPVPMRLQGKEYRAYPLRDIDHEEMTNWCKREYLDRVKASTDDKDMLTLAMGNILGMHWLVGEGRRVAFTVKGLHKLASLFAREEVPYEAVAHPESLSEITSVFVQLHGGGPRRESGTSTEEATEGK